MTELADVAALAKRIEDARRVALFTGAGISTDSGIPDFRSPGGFWMKQRPIEFDDFVGSEELRREAWRRRFDNDPVMRAARPNRGHRAIAALIRTGKAQAVITQNIDGLHQASGIPDEQVIELHGNTTYATCLDCGARYELEPLRIAFERDGAAPRCTHCGGLIKMATISFGQAMPEGPMRRAEAETLACDLFIAIGSSLVVYPAAGFPVLAKRNGATLAIVNRDPTGLDQVADLVINRAIGQVLGNAVGVE
jgi:NAD-dependent deacetylase